jgi:hypothetical protein
MAGATIPSIGATAFFGAIPLLFAIAAFAFFGVDTQALRTRESLELTADLEPSEA